MSAPPSCCSMCGLCLDRLRGPCAPQRLPAGPPEACSRPPFHILGAHRLRVLSRLPHLCALPPPIPNGSLPVAIVTSAHRARRSDCRSCFGSALESAGSTETGYILFYQAATWDGQDGDGISNSSAHAHSGPLESEAGVRLRATGSGGAPVASGECSGTSSVGGSPRSPTSESSL